MENKKTKYVMEPKVMKDNYQKVKFDKNFTKPYIKSGIIKSAVKKCGSDIPLISSEKYKQSVIERFNEYLKYHIEDLIKDEARFSDEYLDHILNVDVPDEFEQTNCRNMRENFAVAHVLKYKDYYIEKMERICKKKNILK